MIVSVLRGLIVPADQNGLALLGSGHEHDLKDGKVSLDDNSVSISPVHLIRENEADPVGTGFWKIFVAFCIITLASPEKVDRKRAVCELSSYRVKDRFLLFSFTIPQFARFSSLEVSALQEPSSSPLTVPFTLGIDCTFEYQFEFVENSPQ
jgi:hypothetical protein